MSGERAVIQAEGQAWGSAADLHSDQLCPGRLVSVVYDTMGNWNCGLLSCSALSEFHSDFPRTNDPAVSDHRRSCLYCGAASETPQTDLSGSVLHDPDGLQPQRGAGNSDRYFSVKADSGQAEGDQIRVSVLGYSNPDLDIGWGCAVSLVRSECRAFPTGRFTDGGRRMDLALLYAGPALLRSGRKTKQACPP